MLKFILKLLCQNYCVKIYYYTIVKITNNYFQK